MNLELQNDVGTGNNLLGANIAATVTLTQRKPAITVATVPALLVHLDDDGILHWKPDDVKGARWRSSKSDSISEVCRQADEVMPERYVIDYVSSKQE